jgi:OOP family OmpA-OmpF porin
VLADLDFPSGETDLPEDRYASLAALASFLEANPGTTVALVGHTDAVGGAEGNIAISRSRAESARALLTARYGADPGRVEAFGMGYFAPVASNATPEGREANRRVEAVVTSTE